MPDPDQKEFFTEKPVASNSSEEKRPVYQPLAARMRPRALAEVVGQEHILGADCLLPRLVRTDRFGSIIFCQVRITPYHAQILMPGHFRD